MKVKHFIILNPVFILMTFLLLFSCSDESADLGIDGGGPDAFLPFFSDVANEAMVGDTGFLGEPAAWGDFNDDGCQDLIVGNTDLLPPNVFLFENNCDGTFTDVTIESGILDLPLRSVSWADYDNDGLLDLSVATVMGGEPSILYRNLDGALFQDVSEDAGITMGGGLVFHTIWADFDNDGQVDMFQADSGFSFLYRNNGDGTFTEVSTEAGIDGSDRTRSAIWFDFDNDGFPELFLANEGFNRFYLNNGNGTFTDITSRARIRGDADWRSVAACAGDYNSDGFLDLYVSNISSGRNALYRNNGDGAFSDVTVTTGTGDVGDGRTCAWVDFDGDGLLDLLSTNHLNPTKLFRNLGGGKFVNTAEEVGVASPIDVFGATWGDYNNDTYADVFLNGHFGTALMMNSGNANNNLVLELRGDGVSSNSSAIGARVEVFASRGAQIRQVSGGKGCCEQDMLPVHFGLGKDRSVDIIVKWPGGNQCSFDSVDINGGAILGIFQESCDIFSR